MDDKSALIKKLQIEQETRESTFSAGNRVVLSVGSVVVLIFVTYTGLALYSDIRDTTTAEAPASVVAPLRTQQDASSLQKPPETVPTGATVLDASGYVTARRRATVSSKITGRVAEVLVEEGDIVTEGQLLARLDSSLMQAQVDLSASRLEATKAALPEHDVAIREARLVLDRMEHLAAQSLASQSDLDSARLRLERALAQYHRAESDVEVSKSSLKLRIEELRETEIRAPFGGVVVNKTAQPGEIVSPMSAGSSFTRTGICALVDMSSLEVEVDVSESNINRVTPGQPVTARLNAYPQDPIAAEVITVIPTADRNRATVSVRIRFTETNPHLLPDMGVRVSFLESKQSFSEVIQ